MREYARRNRSERIGLFVVSVLVALSAAFLVIAQSGLAAAETGSSLAVGKPGGGIFFAQGIAGGSSTEIAVVQGITSGRPGPQLAQITVRPDAPKRVFEEKEDKPWTLLIGKAMLPATLGLGAFLVLWYVVKLSRTRYGK